MFAAFAVQQGICQQAAKAKSTAEATATGAIKTITRGFNFVVSVPEENGQARELTIILPKDVKISMDGNAAGEDDLRMGKMVVVDYTTRKAASGTNDASTDKKTVRTAKNISIIFNDNPPPLDKQTAQQQASTKILANYLGSWTSIEGDSTQQVHDSGQSYQLDAGRS